MIASSIVTRDNQYPDRQKAVDGSLLKPENFLFHSSVRQKKEEEVLNLELLERQAVEKAMRLSEGNITRAAEYLGITRFALYRKLEKLGL